MVTVVKFGSSPDHRAGLRPDPAPAQTLFSSLDQLKGVAGPSHDPVRVGSGESLMVGPVTGRQGGSMMSSPHAHRLFLAAAVAGVAHAVPTLYWVLGGTALVSTLGQWAGDWQRESPGEVAVLLSLIFLAKLAGALLPLINERGLLPFPRVWRGLFWCVAAVLVAYGVVNVFVALAALGGIIGHGRDDGRRSAGWSRVLVGPVVPAVGSVACCRFGREPTTPLWGR